MRSDACLIAIDLSKIIFCVQQMSTDCRSRSTDYFNSDLNLFLNNIMCKTFTYVFRHELVSIYRWIAPSIHPSRSGGRLVSQSVGWSVDPSIHRSIDASIHIASQSAIDPSFHSSQSACHQLIHLYTLQISKFISNSQSHSEYCKTFSKCQSSSQ